MAITEDALAAHSKRRASFYASVDTHPGIAVKRLKDGLWAYQIDAGDWVRGFPSREFAVRYARREKSRR